MEAQQIGLMLEGYESLSPPTPEVVRPRRVRRKKAPAWNMQIALELYEFDDAADAELDANKPNSLVNEFVHSELTTDDVVSLHLQFLELSVHQYLHKMASAALCGDILEWMLSENVGPFTFRTCCQIVGIDYRAFRSRVNEEFDDRVRSEGRP